MFDLSETNLILKRTCRDLATKEIAPFARSTDINCVFPYKQIKKMSSLGLMGVFIPNEMGGAGLDTLSYVLAMEEISKACASCGVIMSVNNSLFCDPVAKFGSIEQKNNILTKHASGELLGAFALSEPGNGSDAAALLTTAVKKGDNYILNGTKSWVTNGCEAQNIIIFATTNVKAGFKGISAFIVPKTTKGLLLGKKEVKLGIRGSSTCNIILENCIISSDQLLGKEGEGFKIAMSSLDGGRIGIGSQALGIAQASLEIAIQYAQERKAFGKQISSFQLIQLKISEMSLRIEQARLLLWKTAILKDQKKKFTKFSAMAKLAASETATYSAHQAIQILGGNGYINDYPVERYYRDARITEIYEGTSEIQRIVIASQVLKEYKV